MIYINVDSLNKAEKLENSLDEFNTLVHSSGTEIIKTLKFNQKIPITSSFLYPRESWIKLKMNCWIKI